MNVAYSLPLVVLLCGYVYAAKSRYDDFEFNNAWPLTRRGGRVSTVDKLVLLLKSP